LFKLFRDPNGDLLLIGALVPTTATRPHLSGNKADQKSCDCPPDAVWSVLEAAGSISGHLT